MADQVKELFHKTFTTSEISNGTTYNFTSDANTAYVIKDIQTEQSANSTTKVTATASIGTTTDFNASPSKFMDLGTVASAAIDGATGSEIMDVSSTFSIRLAAQPIAFADIQHSQLCFQSTSDITEVTAVTPFVDGAAEASLTPVVLGTTSVNGNFNAYQSQSNCYQWRQLVQNPITNVKTAIAYINSGNNNQYLLVGSYDSTANGYVATNSQYQPFDFDGRFVYNMNGTGYISYYDTKGSAARAPTTWPHGSLLIKNRAGNTIGLASNMGTYPKWRLSYLSDVNKNYIVVGRAYNSGLYLIEMPTYDGSDGAALPNNTATTGFWQMCDHNWSSQTNAGPSPANMLNPARIQSLYSQSNELYSWHIGSSAASTTKRILIFQDGNTTNNSNRLWFLIADTETMEQNQNNTGNNHAYSASLSLLNSEFGWDTSGSSWNEASGVAAYINCLEFKTLTGSDAQWGTESSFYLDNDVLTFTNLASSGTGEGPIIQWNLKTNAVTAPITWAQYVNTSGGSLANPGGADSLVGHKTFASTPTSSEINARTYTKAPSLSIRATGIKEDRS